MPNVPTACRTKGCGGYAADRGLCQECLKNEKPPERVSKFDRRKEWKHLYRKSRWRNHVQPAVLRRDPICRICSHNPSTVADHIRDHRGDETLFFDFKNLQGVCEPCHDNKTGTEHGIGREKNLPPKPTAVPEPGSIPPDVDFTKLLNLDPKKKKE
ncbi:Uncharacterised protein [uncultured archaeon]|nr:Uncharacterised protein [uncultured archaeon]